MANPTVFVAPTKPSSMLNLLFGTVENYLTPILNTKIMIGAVLLNVLANLVLPDSKMLFVMIFCLVTDFITGLLKAYVTRQAITSKRMRDTVGKVSQYSLLVALVIIMSNFSLGSKHEQEILFVVNGIYALLVLIELVSVFENVRDMAPNSRIAKVIISPILSMLNARTRAIQNQVGVGQGEDKTLTPNQK